MEAIKSTSWPNCSVWADSEEFHENLQSCKSWLGRDIGGIVATRLDLEAREVGHRESGSIVLHLSANTTSGGLQTASMYFGPPGQAVVSATFLDARPGFVVSIYTESVKGSEREAKMPCIFEGEAYGHYRISRLITHLQESYGMGSSPISSLHSPHLPPPSPAPSNGSWISALEEQPQEEPQEEQQEEENMGEFDPLQEETEDVVEEARGVGLSDPALSPTLITQHSPVSQPDLDTRKKDEKEKELVSVPFPSNEERDLFSPDDSSTRVRPSRPSRHSTRALPLSRSASLDGMDDGLMYNAEKGRFEDKHGKKRGGSIEEEEDEPSHKRRRLSSDDVIVDDVKEEEDEEEEEEEEEDDMGLSTVERASIVRRSLRGLLQGVPNKLKGLGKITSKIGDTEIVCKWRSFSRTLSARFSLLTKTAHLALAKFTPEFINNVANERCIEEYFNQMHSIIIGMKDLIDKAESFSNMIHGEHASLPSSVRGRRRMVRLSPSHIADHASFKEASKIHLEQANKWYKATIDLL